MESPQSPAPPPPPGPESPAAYGGPVPPGGWQQPIPQHQAWVGQPLASWGSRAAALLIDWLILLVPVIVLTIIVVAVATGSDTGAIVTGILGGLAYLVVLFVYAPTLMARDGRNNGQTWGKQIDRHSRRPRQRTEQWASAWPPCVRSSSRGFCSRSSSSIIPLIPWLLDYLWPLWDDENRALHDMVVSTHVVRV